MERLFGGGRGERRRHGKGTAPRDTFRSVGRGAGETGMFDVMSSFDGTVVIHEDFDRDFCDELLVEEEYVKLVQDRA
jgi:hypothetical protein